MSLQINYNDDGINHINIYSKGKTDFGRMLSNFYHFEIETEDGIFQSVEAYWHYLGINPEDQSREELRNLYGFDAKDLGIKLRKKNGIQINDNDFQRKISNAIFYKFERNIDILKNNEKYLILPFEHYYNFNGKIVDVKNKYNWMIKNISYMRSFIIDNLL